MNGRYRVCIEAWRERKNPQLIGEPPGTLSLLVRVHTAALDLVAEAFLYRRPNGEIGASGQPDPKQLVIGRQLLKTPAVPPGI